MKICLFLIGLVLLIAFVSADDHANTKTAEHQVENSGVADNKKSQGKAKVKKFNHSHAHAKSGKSTVITQKKDNVEKGGKKHRALAKGVHHVQVHQQDEAAHGSNMKAKNHDKKLGLKRGFREQYHKNEQKKSDNWYSNKHKGGEWVTFGSGKAKHHVVKHEQKDTNKQPQPNKSQPKRAHLKKHEEVAKKKKH